MDVDVDSFEEALGMILERFPESSFVAMDLEMTGVRLDSAPGDSRQDLPEQRYAQARQAASRYGIVQVGLCLFERADAEDARAGYVARPFNFFVFPRPVNEPPKCYISPKILLDADAVHFVRCAGVDFGRWVGKGVLFLDRLGEESLRSALAHRWSPPPAPSGAREAREDEVTGAEVQALEGARGGFAAASTCSLTDKPPRLQQAILKAMRERRPGEHIVVERRPGPLGGCRAPAATMRNLGPGDAALAKWQEGEREEAERYLREQSGFRRVWKALLESGKPLILHNGLLDLLYAYQWFEEPLPETFAGFEAVLGRTMATGTQVFDTKWIASYADVGAKLGHQQKTGLEALCLALERQGRGTVPRIEFPPGLDKYSQGGSAFHEAAYDAFCTGKLFAYFCAMEGEPNCCSPPSALSPPKKRGTAKQGAIASPLKEPAKTKEAQASNRFAVLMEAEEETTPSQSEAASPVTDRAAPSSPSSDANEARMDGEEQRPAPEAEAANPRGRRGAPPLPSLACAANKVFLMSCIWDLAWGPSAVGDRGGPRPPIQYTADGKRVAVCYLHGVQRGAARELTRVLQQAAHRTAVEDPIPPWLDVRWCGDVACVLLSPQDRADQAWQDVPRLDARLQAIMEGAQADGGGHQGDAKKAASPPKAVKPASAAASPMFEWCWERTLALA